MSLDDQLACVARELKFRRQTYPRFVKQKKLTQTLADKEMANMEAVYATLQRMRSAGGLKWCARCECLSPTIDEGKTCGTCKVVLG